MVTTLPSKKNCLGPPRTTLAAALPEQAVVFYEPEVGLVSHAVLCTDGHAQERPLTEPILDLVRTGQRSNI